VHNLNDDLGLAQLFRAESGRILSVLMLQTRDITLAEDALQDAFIQANDHWRKNGLPIKPAAWILTTARRRLIDRIRKESHRIRPDTLQAIQDTRPNQKDEESEDKHYPDERLRLIFTCCHPALAENVRVPLTLKTLCGLSTREIARAYLVSEHAMEQRLTRAKRKIRDAGIAYEVPQGHNLKERLDSVLSVICLLYNESYSAFEGQSLTRQDLAQEAIQLARLLKKLLPKPEVNGLLALLILHDSRRAARSSETQSFIALEHQDRSEWDQPLIEEGVSLISSSLKSNTAGTYQIQAAISALHSLAKSWAKTDWPQISQLYSLLLKINPSPVVAINKAVADAYAGDLISAQQQMAKLESDLQTYQPFYAARAELFTLVDNNEGAIKDFQKAISLTRNEAEKEFLMRKLEAIQSIASH